MNYRDAYDYLNSFTDYEKVPGSDYTKGSDNLTRVDLLLRLLGNPQASFDCIIIAGTKGKGSVAAMVDSMLREAGVTTGLYTSPHLESFRERIRVNGEMIPPSDVARLVEQLQPVVDQIKSLGAPSLMPSTYELATALAFLYFQERGVKLAVLEVGLGGRLDAVNITNPLVSVITSISLDHTQVLGSTIGEIAGEKAGIIKKQGTVITAPQPPEAMETIKRVAAAQRATLTEATNNVYVSTHHLPEVVSDDKGVPVYQVFTLAYEATANQGPGRIRVKLPLLGSHQQVNAAVAVAAVRALADSGIEVTREQILEGFKKVKWPGRLEIVRRDPVVVIDGAHNTDSMSKLNQAMYDLFYGRKLVVVLGISRDKDVDGILAELGTGPGSAIGPRVEKIIVTRSAHARAAQPNNVANAAKKRGFYVETRDNVPEALATAVGIARAGSKGSPDDPVVLVTGSLFIVAEARRYFGLAPDLSEEQS